MNTHAPLQAVSGQSTAPGTATARDKAASAQGQQAAPADLAMLDIDALAGLLAQHTHTQDAEPDIPDIAAFAGQEPCLSLAQERLWFMDRLVPGNPFYNIPFAFRLEGPVQEKALCAAWQDVVQRHEGLRISIAATDTGTAVVRCRPAEDFPLVVQRNVSREGLARLMHHEAATGFHLEKDPLLRASLCFCEDAGCVLVFTAHHIVFDGWSVGIFLADLNRAYSARCHNVCPDVAPPAVSYFQYAAWHRALVQKNRAAQASWWQEHLANLPDFEPQTDFPRPAAQTFHGAVHSLHIDADITAAMDELAAREQVTPYALWLTLFALTAARFAAQQDFAIGSSFAGRTLPATEDLAGFFVENLTVRMHIDPQLTLHELVHRVQEESLATMEHALLPFQMLTEALGRERDLSRNPVYQLAFSYQNMHTLTDTATDQDGLRLTALPVQGLTTHMDLELLAWPGREGMACQFLYATDLFQPATIAAFAESFRALATSLARQAEQGDRTARPVHSLGLDAGRLSLSFGSRRRHALLSPWQDFASLCAADPDAEALRVISFAGGTEQLERFSRRQLQEKAEQLSRQLHARGVQMGDVVLLCLDPGAELLAAILAVWRLGAVFTTLATDHPASLARWLCEDARVVCVLSQRRDWQGDPALLLEPDAGRAADSGAPAHADLCAPAAELLPPPPEPAPETCVCILYTSGSTGRPKAVRLSAAALSNRLHWMWEQFPMQRAEVCCQKTSPVFVDFLWEALGPLLAGVPLLCLPDRKTADIPWFLQTLERHKVTRLVLVPSLLALMHRVANGLEGRLTSLRILTASGETLPGDLAAATLERLPSLRLLNLYGSTEVMGDATFHEVQHAQTGSVPIGIPVHNTVAAILDAAGALLPQGATGRLYVAGTCLATGYGGAAAAMNNVWLTPEQHEGIPDAAFAALVRQSGESRWFATGDLARMDEQGLLHHCGRADRQIKRRGVRIEPEQIQAVLERHARVAEARVLAVTGPAGSEREGIRPEPRLVAYILPARGGAQCSSEKESRAACLQQWASLYDSMYASVRRQGHILDNFLIWESSYTGRHLPAEDMREWLAESLASIHALAPRSVLEVGCGQGFLLMDLIRSCDRYAGIDISREALACLEEVLAQEKSQEQSLEQSPEQGQEQEQEQGRGRYRARLSLHVGEAADLSVLDGQEPFDTAIFNSVVQYFPDAAYCIEAVRKAVEHLEYGGRVFLGDIRNLAGLDLLHLAIQAHRCPGTATAREVLDRANSRKRLESELVLAPAFWHALQRLIPRIAAVQTAPKRGTCANELTEFRYEVVLYCDTSPFVPFAGRLHVWGSPCPGPACQMTSETPESPVARACPDYLDCPDALDALLAAFAAEESQSLAIASIPQARIARYRALQELAEESMLRQTQDSLETLKARAAAQVDAAPAARGLTPEELHSLAARHNLALSLSLDRCDGQNLNALFFRNGAQPPLHAVPWPGADTILPEPAALASTPATSRDESSLRAELRSFLAAELPQNMLPDVLMTVPAWPRTPSGKIDWKRLPAPGTRYLASVQGMQLPSTADEKCLADIWKLVIGLDEVSVHDNFFETGGTSLLLTQVHQLIQTRLGLSFPLSVLFQYPTIHGLSGWLAGRGGSSAGAAAAAPAASRAVARTRRGRRPLRQSPTEGGVS